MTRAHLTLAIIAFTAFAWWVILNFPWVFHSFVGLFVAVTALEFINVVSRSDGGRSD